MKIPNRERRVNAKFDDETEGMAEFSHFLELARLVQSNGHPAGSSAGPNQGREFDMQFFDAVGSKLAAAFFSLAFSAVMLAAAIVPANQGALLPGVA